MIGQTVIVSYMKDVANDTPFTMRAIELKFCTGVYGVRLHLLTRLEPGTVRKKQKLWPIVQSETSGHWAKASACRLHVSSLITSSLMLISNRGHAFRVGSNR